MCGATMRREAVQPAAEPPAVQEGFGRDAFAAATGASDSALAALDAYLELLTEWNGRMNLVGPSALASFWLRHAYDSAQLLTLAPSARVWADLGSGAGLPGVVLAILLKDRPGAELHLVESMHKRSRFLAEVARQLDLPATIHTRRAEDIAPPGGLEVVTARACAPLTRLLAFAYPCLAAGAVGLFLKGRDVEHELTEARLAWQFDSLIHTSLSDPSGRVLQLQKVTRV
jgi:16S rRNA (guanine527-N7)-methyltransferase